MDIRQAIRYALGGGADINAANPLPVDISAGDKAVDTVLDEATIAAAATTALADCSLGGTHSAAAHATIMTDALAHFRASALIGLTINNLTDGSAGVITANTTTTVTAVLAGGAANTWATDDAYSIEGSGLDLLGGPGTLALTVEAVYNAAAVLGIRVHVRTSPTNDATGTHTPAGASATIMTDANALFQVNELVGLRINNSTDGSSGVVTANTLTTVTVAALAGGTTDTWQQNDVYSIPGADYDTIDWDVWNPSFTAGAAIRQTQHYDVSPGYVKVLVENLDAAQTVTDVTVRATVGA